MADTERLFLLDGMALLYRAYFSFISRPLISSKGVNTSAIYGFSSALMRILDIERPDHVAVVFDTPEPTFRHKLYKEYKATRQKMPEDMAIQLEAVKEIVRAFNTPLIELPGYEADDIIGTLARRAEKERVLTYLVTGDKDFMQLISPLVKMYKPGKSGGEPEIVEEAGVAEKFGVRPEQVIEVLGLTGDTSDNVPGVPGVGEKTAIPLIQKYGSIAELYKHVDEIPQKGLREKLITGREKALLSRELVTVHTSAPIPIDFHQLRAAPRDTARLLRLFEEFELKSLTARLKEKAAATEEQASEEESASELSAATTADADISFDVGSLSTTDITTDRHTYTCVTTEKELQRLAALLKKAKQFVVDTETTAPDPIRSSLVGLSFSVKEREGFYVPVRYTPEAAPAGEGLFGEVTDTTARHNHCAGALLPEQVIEAVRPALEDPKILKIGQNLKFDLLVLKRYGVEIQGPIYDTMVASYILRADLQHNLDALALGAFNYKMVSFEDLVGKGKNQKHITEVQLEEITNYSSEDADFTMRLYGYQRPKLEEMGFIGLCEKIEFPLVQVLARMEHTGVALDVDYLAGMSKDLERQLQNLVKDIHHAAGEEFNINSTQQLGAILFTKLHLPVIRKTKTGYSTDVSVLETLNGLHPIIEKLLEYRQLVKLKSTYIDALPTLINPATGRVHTSFNQTITSTGRLSSSDPNLQNIPIRTEIGRSIRQAFVPGGKGMVMMSADYSQIELRIMAHISGDEGLVQAFRNNEDIHATTAAKVFGVPPKEVTRDMRRKAKEVNFGIMYGIGPFGLSNRLGITQNEAKEIIARYFERFPKVRQYINDTLAGARANGYVSTLHGRRRYIPDINSRNQAVRGNAERQAINMPIQGTAADMIKVAMIAIDEEIRVKKLKSRMLLQVHDELVFEVPQKEVEKMKSMVTEKMKHALEMSVPINVDVGTGGNWLEAH